ALRMRVVLLDVEGTTTDKRFVTETLFPYARQRIVEFLRTHEARADVAAAIAALRAEHGSAEAIGHELERWIDADKKQEPLKTLQGLIWEAGYADGTLLAHVYPDVPGALQRWTNAGARVAIFSSGSVHAQRLLFGHTIAGDLLSRLSAHFDLA